MIVEILTTWIILGIGFGLATFYRIFIPAFNIVSEVGVELKFFHRFAFYFVWQTLTILIFPLLVPSFMFRDTQESVLVVSESIIEAFDDE